MLVQNIYSLSSIEVSILNYTVVILSTVFLSFQSVSNRELLTLYVNMLLSLKYHIVYIPLAKCTHLSHSHTTTMILLIRSHLVSSTYLVDGLISESKHRSHNCTRKGNVISGKFIITG